jgi:ABC-type branched-subunit amino acid transport system substrate-binding protein
MAVDLFTLVDALKGSVNAPGDDNFPGATSVQWAQQLGNAFWEAFRFGFFRGYRVNPDDFEIVATTAATDMAEEDQQLIVLFAAYKAVRNKLLALATRETYKAPGVEATIERSAQVMQAILKDIKAQLDEVITVAGQGTRAATAVAMFDNLMRRDAAALASVGYDAGVWVR